MDNNKPSQIATMMNLIGDVLPQYRQEAPKTPPHIILHYSAFKTAWDWMILIFTFYTACMVPYTSAFKSKTLDNVHLLVVDSIVDVVFFVDIILNFHTTFVGPAGEVVSDAKVIRMNYMKSWFVIDLLSCLPYDVFNAFQHVDDNISSLFSALKVIRLLRLGRVARKLDHYIEYGAAVLILLILMFVLIAHWFACIWYTIGDSEAKANIKYNWLHKLSNEIGKPYRATNKSGETVWQGGPTAGQAYSSSLYYTLSCMTSVGFGNVSSTTEMEKAFTICMMILGSLLYATIFGNVTTIFQQMYSSTGRYHDMLNSVREFMKLHDVPRSLSERVMDYVVSTWAITKGIDTAKVLNYCPKDMKADICVHLNRKVFNEHPAFRLASDGCLRALAMHFNLSHSAPGDMLFHQGESLDSLCFIVAGSLEVIQDDEVVAILSRGDVFGEQCWRESTVGQSTANVRGLTYCDLHIIKREHLLEVLDFYHAFANSFARNLTLTYNLRHRLVFRKVADVKREKELAEKRKNDPPLELAADHPVRRLISRFRKINDKSLIQNNKDPEKGEQTGNNVQNKQGIRPKAVASKVISISENSTSNQPKPKPSAAVRWGKFLNRGASTPVTPAPSDDKKSKPVKEKDGQNNQIQSIVPGATKPTNHKPISKWGKFLANRQETIQETSEEPDNTKLEGKSNLRKVDSNDSGILRSDAKLDQIETGEDAPLTQRDIICSVSGSNTVSTTEQHIISSLYDIRLEIKEEIETLNQKMSKIDDQIADLLKLFSPNSTPFSSNTSSIVSSQAQSSGENTSCNSSVGSNSIVSPRGSVPSSPSRSLTTLIPGSDSHTNPLTNSGGKHILLRLAKARVSGNNNGKEIPTDIAPTGSSKVITPPVPPKPATPPKPNLTGGTRSQAASNDNSSRSTPPQLPSSDRGSGSASSSGHDSSRSSRRRKTSGARTRVAPSNPDEALGGIVSAADDENIHVKDQDLDLF